VLTSVRITAGLTVDPQAHVFWKNSISLKLDCFICRRRDRTVLVERGDDHGRCVSERKPPDDLPPGIYNYDEVSYKHPMPIRVSAFDWWHERGTSLGERLWLRCRLDLWWAPFRDRKNASAAMMPATHPGVSLSYHVGCRACMKTQGTAALNSPGPQGLAGNMIFPESADCPTCDRTLATATEAPEIAIGST
jgi:hypothetical protein